MTRTRRFSRLLAAAGLFSVATASLAIAPACREAVLLVHDSGGSPADFEQTVTALQAAGYDTEDIIMVSWGAAGCSACNNHNGAEEAALSSGLERALQRSCIGDIDVIAHGMGVTLAGQQIVKLGVADRVDAFIAVAGALRGLNVCGRYPFHMPVPICGSRGLSVGSPFLAEMAGKRFGHRVYSIKSYSDEWICRGSCFVNGTHSSNVWGQDGSWTFDRYGHLDLLAATTGLQLQLVVEAPSGEIGL